MNFYLNKQNMQLATHEKKKIMRNKKIKKKEKHP